MTNNEDEKTSNSTNSRINKKRTDSSIVYNLIVILLLGVGMWFLADHLLKSGPGYEPHTIVIKEFKKGP